MKIKILIISTVEFRLNGITSVILNYYRFMEKEKFQIDFILLNQIDKKLANELLSKGSNVFYISRNSNPIKYISRLNKIMKKNNYDIVHIHGNSSTMAMELIPAFITRIPVRIVHSHNTTTQHPFIHKILYPLFSFLYTDAFACGEEAGKWLFLNKPFIVLNNGINLKTYKFDYKVRKKIRGTLKYTENEIVLGHVGHFSKQKNHEFLLDFFSELLMMNKRYRLLLIGEGELEEKMKQKAKELLIDNQIIFLGKTNNVNDYLQAMDLFVLPSLYEGLPVVLIEAQANGLYCMVSDKVSKESDMTGHLNFISINNTKEWVDKANMIFEEIGIDKRDEMSENSQTSIKNKGYDINVNANCLKDIYINLYQESRKIK